AEWVKTDGWLFATAGAGMFDEFNQPNKVLRELLGVDEKALEHSAEDVKREKEHLPFARPLDNFALQTPGFGAKSRVTPERPHAAEAGPPPKRPVFGAKSRVTASQDKDTSVMGTFADGSPAIVARKVGKGATTYYALLPGLSYFKPAIPLRPVDRGATDDTMAPFIPTKFDDAASRFVGPAAAFSDLAVECCQHPMP